MSVVDRGNRSDEELEQAVGERTWPLSNANGALRREAAERQRAEELLRDSHAWLAGELAAEEEIQSVGNPLVPEDDLDVLYGQILDAAVALMRADMGSIQMYSPDRNELRLLAWKGFHPASAAFWQRVRADSCGSCGAALIHGQRVVVVDAETCDFMAGSEDLQHFRLSGIRSMQSTPLISRRGRLVGMISTHWRIPHTPTDRELRLLDVLARQAADLIESRKMEEALRESEARQAFLLQLSDAQRPLTDAVEIQAQATSMLGRHLGVDGAFYCEYDEEAGRGIVHPDFRREGSATFAGVYGDGDFPVSLTLLRSGHPVVLGDTRYSPLLMPEERERCIGLDMRAIVSMPLVKNHRLVGVLTVFRSSPHEWTPLEVSLVEASAERTWSAIERARAEAALRESEAKYRALFDAMDQGYFLIDVIFDEDDRPVDLYYGEANAAATRMLGQDYTGRRLRQIHPDLEEFWYQLFGEVVRTGRSVRAERYAGPLGRWYDFYLFRFGGPESRRIGSVFQDVTERKEAEQQLRRSQEEFRRLAENSPDVIARLDRDYRVTYVSPAIEKLTGLPAAAFLGKTGADFGLGLASRERWDEIMGEVFESGEQAGRQFIFRGPDGQSTSFDVVLVPEWGADGSVETLLGIARDVTRLKEGEEQLQFLATHDCLTGLPNRALLHERLQTGLLRCQRSGTGAALLYIDLDHFKPVNDTLGHEVGDELLQTVASRLSGSTRKSDLVARIGGDEFAVVLEDVRQPEEVGWIAGNIVNALARPFHLRGRQIYISASVGIAVFPADGKTAETLLRHADTAMYKAKEEGKNHYRFFSRGMDGVAREKLFLSASLRGALEKDELALVYQPRVDSRTGRIVGVEALIRWHSPERGLVLPARFVGLAEETGMIEPIGEWVLRTACRQLAAWNRAGAEGFCMAVNLSPRQFRQPALASRIAGILQESGVRPDSLELEITESAVMANPEKAKKTLDLLADLGIALALDDFGTGHSSLAYLQRFPVHRLKIDQSFVRELPDSLESANITRAIIAMAHSLGLDVTAEGVESEGQRAFLLEAGCETWQGYLCSEPVEAEEIARLMGLQG